MGNAAGTEYTPSNVKKQESVTAEEAKELFRFPDRVDREVELRKFFECNVLSCYSVLDEDPLKAQIQSLLFPICDESASFSSKESRAIACFLGMPIGDALGAPLEFSPVTYDSSILQGFNEEHWSYPFNRFSLKPGQWTDDASMGLCLAESLLSFPEFNPIDLRVRFLNWWDFGYRNAFNGAFQSSVGLGGCIGMSFTEFRQNKSEFTAAGDPETSGNGSIMRLAAVPVFYHDDLETALSVAQKQSKTTHQGNEAAECCRLMTHIIIGFINAPAELTVQERKELVLGELSSSFHSDFYSIQCLAASKNEEKNESNSHLDMADRKWDWKNQTFKYAHSRATQQPGYIGSYCMDGLAMALHCVWKCETFQETLLTVVNLRGDADTVGSIAGQIAGSLYGVEEIPKEWIKAIQKWDNEGTIALTAAKLFRKEIIIPPQTPNIE